MTPSDPGWLELLQTEADRTSIGAVAQLLDYSRTSISLALGGKYPGGTANMEAKVMATLGTARMVDCPYSGLAIPAEHCRDLSTRRAPTHNPTLMGQWGACQQCQNKCKGDAQ